MLSRREFAFLTASGALAAGRMMSRERLDRALQGREVDRTPFSFWHHFGLENFPGERHAQATLEFHRKFRTDLVKVMSDYPYPKPAGRWYDLQPLDNPFPEQIRALRIIREGLRGEAHFVETIFNPWNVAEKLSSPKEVRELQAKDPNALLNALETIAKSEANHARKAVAAGASGVFLAIANAQDGVQSREDYAKFSAPFDLTVLRAVANAPLNILHLHGDEVYLDLFVAGWPAAALNYSPHATGVSITEYRRRYKGPLLAGLDERNYRSLQPDQLKEQWRMAQRQAGPKLILTPGCSVPNDSTDEELSRLPRVLGA